MSSSRTAEQQLQPESHESFVKNGAGLSVIPAKVMAMSDLGLLDVSDNDIEVVPKGLFPNIDKLKTLILSHNCITSLPDDISSLRVLERLAIGHNDLTSLPDGLFMVTTLQDMDISHNSIELIPDQIGCMENLQVLNVASNCLRTLPCGVGWLNLKQLDTSGNSDLNIKDRILQGGVKSVMGYLQVVGEQHQLISQHMAVFSSKLRELQQKHGLVLGSLQDEESAALRVKIAARLGIVSCSNCQLTAVPARMLNSLEASDSVRILDLSHNRLMNLQPQYISKLEKLLVADLSFNSLKAVPEGCALHTVAVLNLAFNKLASLPADIGVQMPNLQQLYLANNYLTSLPASLANTPVHDMFLSENNFDRVPQVVGRCNRLVKLSLAACELTHIGDELAGLSNLRFLDLSFNKTHNLPDSISSLASCVERLNLGYNPFKAFPAVLTTLTNLKELNIDYTGVSEFPKGLGELRRLDGLQADGCPLTPILATLYAKDPLLLVKVHDTQLLSLDLSDAGLDEVPQQVLHLTQLTSLNLLKNTIKDLPLGLGGLRKLRELHLKGNPLRQPFLKIMDTKGEVYLTAFLRPEGNAGVLELDGCGFETLPKEVWEVPGRVQSLMELNLTNNRLKDLPHDLSKLVNLTQLILDNNLLRSLPAMVFNLPSLAVLMASGNGITYLPEALGTAEHLQALVLHSNQLMQLPESVTTLTSLRALGLASNRLWQLPSGTAGCSGLRLLDCSHNLMTRLPEGMGKLRKLRSLKLTHNKLRWIPVDELRSLTGLTELDVVGNAFMVDVQMNASDLMSVQQLLSALADSPAGETPPPLQAFSRSPTNNTYSNVSSSSPSLTDRPGAQSPSGSRFTEGNRTTSVRSSAVASGVAGGPRRSAVRWQDDDSSQLCSTGSSPQPLVDGTANLHAADARLEGTGVVAADGDARKSSEGQESVLVNQVSAAVKPEEAAGICSAARTLQQSQQQMTRGSEVDCERLQQSQEGNSLQLQHPSPAPVPFTSDKDRHSDTEASTDPSATVAAVSSDSAVTSASANAGGSCMQPVVDPSSHAASAKPDDSTAASGEQLLASLLAATSSRPESPLQQTDHWDKVPVMEVPGIIKALILEPPPPPPKQRSPGAEDEQLVRRPQTRGRFRRVMEQTARAMEILETMAAAGVAEDQQAAAAEAQQ